MNPVHKILAFGAISALAVSAFAATNVTTNITTNTLWTTAGNPYILDHVIFVKDGATLDIAPGVIIRGQPRDSLALEDAGSLVVTKTGKIQMRGTAASPIIMTTAALTDGAGSWLKSGGKPVRWTGVDTFYDANPVASPLAPLDGGGAKNVALWGGLIIAGDSLTNNYQDVDGDTIPDNGQGLIEGLVGADTVYGGYNSEHDGGTVNFVSIRHGGDGIVDGKEINGLTLYAVGSKTKISNVEVYCNSDDGCEIFGGTVNVDHLNLNYCDDDGLDMDEGFQGSVQFVFSLQGLGYGDSGMELDGDDHDEGQALAPLDPISDARIYNATVATEAGGRAVRMRNGFSGSLVNSILVRQGAAGGTGVAIEGDNGDGDMAPFAADHFGTGKLRVSNVTAFNFTTAYTAVSGGAVSLSAAGAVTGTYGGLAIPNVYYPATVNRSTAGFNPGLAITSHTVANGVNPVPPVGNAGAAGTQAAEYLAASIEFTTYRGAFDPAKTTQWTFGWTALNKRGILTN